MKQITDKFKVGDRVVYRAYSTSDPEEGTVTSINTEFVFVRYGSDIASKATHPRQLSLANN